MNKIDYDALNEILSKASTDRIFKSKNVNEAYSIFEKIVDDGIEDSSSVRSKTRNKSKWFDRELLKIS